MDVALWRTTEAREALAAHDIGTVYRLLQRRGHSQRAIAARTGQVQSEISEIMAGRRVQSVALLQRIADGLGVPRQALGLAAVPDNPTAGAEAPAEIVCLPRGLLRPAASHLLVWTGVEIRALREAYRMTMRKFAAYLGISERMEAKWEAGGASIRPHPVNQAALDTALRRAPAEVQARFANWPIHTRPDPATMVEGVGWIAHVILDVPNLSAALTMAETITNAARHLPRVDVNETTVSREDHQAERFRVFCGRLLPDLPGRVRCARRRGHADNCAERAE